MSSEETAPQVGEAEQEELVGGPDLVPLIRVTARPVLPDGQDGTGVLTVEVFPGDWARGSDAVASVAAAAAGAVARAWRRPVEAASDRRFGFVQVPPSAVEKVFERIRAASGRAASSPGTLRDLEEQLESAERTAQACEQQHRDEVAALRDLVMQARRDKAASDRAASPPEVDGAADEVPPFDEGGMLPPVAGSELAGGVR